MRIAFLGTGLMGAPMARRLLQSGHRVTVWNRTPAKAEALVPDGGTVARSPTAAVASAELVVSILENAEVVEEVLFSRRTASAATPGTLFVDMSSIAPGRARTCAGRLTGMGHRHLDAPVSGGPDGARDGTLAIMVGGEPAAFESARPVLEVMGRPTLVGSSGAGQFAKLTSQMIASTAMAAVAESLLMARAQGIDPLRIREALAGGFADSRILQIHGKRMVERDFIPGGHVRTFVKDLAAARGIAEALDLHLPVTRLAHDLFGALSLSCADCDISAMALAIERLNPPHRIGTNPDRTPEPQPEG